MVIMAESEDQEPVLFPEQVVNGLPTIYSFQSCPFCFKIRALLASRGIRYADVEVEPMKKAELAWSEWSAVPVFVDSDGTAMNE
ncbi:MAG TPA: glutaredoxin domain-containing protein, partial [Candidatus Thalassarchaeaceae archaeon]|nr:glutaredoxin domain-containing protein [Candidatus Thalassarchaeaceae archaeon]